MPMVISARPTRIVGSEAGSVSSAPQDAGRSRPRRRSRRAAGPYRSATRPATGPTPPSSRAGRSGSSSRAERGREALKRVTGVREDAQRTDGGPRRGRSQRAACGFADTAASIHAEREASSARASSEGSERSVTIVAASSRSRDRAERPSQPTPPPVQSDTPSAPDEAAHDQRGHVAGPSRGSVGAVRTSPSRLNCNPQSAARHAETLGDPAGEQESEAGRERRERVREPRAARSR